MYKLLNIFITIDIDLSNYCKKKEMIDEFGIIKRNIMPFMLQNDIKATWFIRIDRKIEKDFGCPDFLFKEYENIIDRLLKNGHVIGWHPHVYLFKNSKWRRNINEEEIISELSFLLPCVRKYSLNVVRMGWGFQTNRIMKFLDDNGFIIDSSAIPRPTYPWEENKKNWTITKSEFYHPSIEDYRITSNDPKKNLKILEVPITTIKISAPYDEGEVIRYCNLAFYNKFLLNPLDSWIKENNFLVTITHPYELSKEDRDNHSLISFNMDEFKKNIESIITISQKYNKKVKFNTLKEVKFNEYS